MPDKDHFLDGLALLANIPFPKPTIVLAPDSLLLSSSSDYYTVQEQILMQCGELGDRVALIDIYDGTKSLESGVISSHRNSIGNNFLNYGISYYPFLETTIVEATDITYANVDQTPAGQGKSLKDIFVGENALIGLANITEDIKNLESLTTSTPNMDFSKNLVNLPDLTTKTGTSYPSWTIAFNAYTPGNPTDILQWQFRVVFTMAWVLNELASPSGLASPAIKLTDTNLISAVKKLSNPQSLVASQITSLFPYDEKYNDGTMTVALGVLAHYDKLTNSAIKKPATVTSPYGDDPSLDFSMASAYIKSVFTVMNKAMNSVSSAANSLLKQYNGTLENNNPSYKKLMGAIAKKAGTLPPSAAMAGVYTLVDNLEGVWISPANRNINSVTEPTVHINNDQQASLNVDALAGKSINAIRSFYGRGPAIIWGARTLDGNSQDWRYVNIRRTMIMIEQSVKNAAEQLVFKSNDASTWTMCESMISNFLFNLWQVGCLQGAVATDAYSVSVGLGKTMTPQDILNGKMKVQVKVAIVHPAEFIIITYEQEMAKS